MTKIEKYRKLQRVIYNDKVIAEISETYVKLYPGNYDKTDRQFCNLVSFFFENDNLLYSKLTIEGDTYVLNSLKTSDKVAFTQEAQGEAQIYVAKFTKSTSIKN